MYMYRVCVFLGVSMIYVCVHMGSLCVCGYMGCVYIDMVYVCVYVCVPMCGMYGVCVCVYVWSLCPDFPMAISKFISNFIIC